MIRFLFALLFSFLLLLSTCASCVMLPRVVHVHHADNSQATIHNTHSPIRDIAHERERSKSLRSSIADRNQAEEALQTLALLEQLYQQEERLWTYYEALHDSARNRQHLLEKRLQLEKVLNEQEAMNKSIDKQLQALRPHVKQNIQFKNNLERN